MHPTRTTAMKVDKLKVRARKNINPPPCGTELSGLLNCFASSGDFLGVGQCAQYSTSLANCMSTKGRSAPKKANSINYHLSKAKTK